MCPSLSTMSVTPLWNDGGMVVAAPDTSPDTSADPRSGSALAVAVEAVASFLSSFDPARTSGEDAAWLVGVFSRVERLGAAGKTMSATRAAQCHPHRSTGHRSAAEWLAAATGESVGQSAGVLELGGELDRQPGVEEALREGRLSAARAKLVSAAVTANPAREADLVAGGEHDTLGQLKERCLRAKAEGRTAQGEARAHQALHRSRRCRTWTDEDGALRVDARLTPDAGAALVPPRGGETRRFFTRARITGVHESPDAYRADALVALVTGTGILGAGPTDITPTTTTAGTDTDTDTTTGTTGTDTGRAGGRAPAPRATIHVRVDLDALRRGSVGRGEVCEIPGVGPVPVRVARDLLGEALCDLVITNGVDVTTIYRMGRSIPGPLRTALLARDQHCVVPGCDTATGLEMDHWQVGFAEGGPVSLDNLARICHHHHQLKTHHGFTLGGGPGHWEWIPPTGVPAPPGTGPPGPAAPPGPTGTDGTSLPLFDLGE